MIGVLDAPSVGSARIPAVVFCTYQLMFAAITPMLAAGAFAERARLGPVMVWVFIWSTIVVCTFPYLAHFRIATDRRLCLNSTALSHIGPGTLTAGRTSSTCMTLLVALPSISPVGRRRSLSVFISANG